jgi:hypothetical protein
MLHHRSPLWFLSSLSAAAAVGIDDPRAPSFWTGMRR